MTTTTDYQKQAIDFLEKSNIDCIIKYSHTGPHFDPNDDHRKIYTVTFKKRSSYPLKQFSITFGSSIATGKCTPYDVLACLTKSDPGSFKNFCSEFDYDTDSRKALKTYDSVCEEWEKVDSFFTKEEIETLQEIQ